MLSIGTVLFFVFGAAAHAAGALEDFAGTWRYHPAKSEPASIASPPAGELRIEVRGKTLRCQACGAGGWTFTGDGRATKSGNAEVANSIQSKWEGSALLINALVTGTPSYAVMDRWKLSRDRSTLTIHRAVQRGSNEAESTLVYLRDGTLVPASENGPEPVTGVTGLPARPEAPAGEAKAASAPAPAAGPPESQPFEIVRGTRIPLRILKGVSSKTAQEGDRVYLETAFPVLAQGRIVIPQGSQVAASVTYVKPAGRVKGRSELMLRFETLVLPNGVTRDFRSRMSSVEPGAGQLDAEGKVKGPGSKGEDARKVGESTAAGAAVGSVVGAATGRYGSGAAIGAAAGAAAGIGRVLGGRGEETGFRGGDVVEMTLDRPLVFTAAELPKPR